VVCVHIIVFWSVM